MPEGTFMSQDAKSEFDGEPAIKQQPPVKTPKKSCFKSTLGIIVVVIFFIIIISKVLTLFSGIDRGNFGYYILGLFIVSIPFAIIIGTRIYRKETLRNKPFMESFSGKYGFTVPQDLKSWQSDCQLLNSGHNRKIFSFIKGNYKGYEIRIYNYKHAFGAYYEDIYGYVVFEFTSKKDLPSSIITPPNSYIHQFFLIGSFDISPSNADKLDTESNAFNNNFQIFVKRDKYNENKLKILEILTPDVMDTLLKELSREGKKDINIEMRNNTVILYKSVKYGIGGGKLIKSEQELLDFLDLFIKLLNAIEK